MILTEQDSAVIRYYHRERQGLPCEKPCAGMKLPAFRAARERLLKSGHLVRTPEGRHVPVAAIAASEVKT